MKSASATARASLFTTPLPWPCRSCPIFPATDLQRQVKTQQRLMHDLRRENFVTKGAFEAAQLCKADQGTVKSQRGKLDLVCKLLVSAGIFEEGAGGGGLHVREKEDECRPSAAQQQRRGNKSSACLEERLACAEKNIARIEQTAREASEEAESAATIAAKANARSERNVSRCTQAQEKCRQVEKTCRDHLDESLEETRERIETNSTRIFHLAAEVEGLTKSMKEGGPTIRTAPIALEETGEIFSVEVADLPSEQRTTATVDNPHQRPTGGRLTPEKRQAQNLAVATKKKKPGEAHDKVERSREGQNLRPGVLGEPWSENRTQDEGGRSPTALLAENVKRPSSPPAWHRRHSTYIGRRVVSSERKATVAAGIVVGPVRPQEERSLPNLVNEAEQTTQPHDLRAWQHSNAEAGAGKDDLVRAELSMPTATLPIPAADPADDGTMRNLSSHGCTTVVSARTDEGHLGAHRHGDGNAQSTRQIERDSNGRPEEERNTSENQQPSPSRQPLVTMTANEAAQALQGVAAQRRCRASTVECDDALSTTTMAGALADAGPDSLLVRTGSPGARLACLGGTPVLWCPQDTWNDGGAPESSSSDDSSTVVVVGEHSL